VTAHASLPPLRAVSFDAGGTLLEVVEPVGATYARLARVAGFAVAANALEAGFRRAFAAAPALAAPAGSAAGLLEFERAWWRALVDAALDHALGGTPQADPAARERFFAAAFAHYAQPGAWRLFPEVRSVLAELGRRGFALAVISNFDRRLHAVLAGLDLEGVFCATVASSEAGAAKPDPGIFHLARRRLGDPPPAQLLHVGDSLREDVHGARAAGWHAVWLDRSSSGAGSAPAGVTRIASLSELPRALQSSVA
jgi:putative hydrolase of the HAD superfamily